MKRLLDYSAILHCATMNKDFINQYRLNLTLKETVDPISLQKAVDLLIPRFPLIFSKMVKDKYWYYVESIDQLKVQKDPGVFKILNHKSVFEQAIVILYKDKRISLEAFHTLTDGTGILTLLKELISLYLMIKDGKETIEIETYHEEELLDSFSVIDPSDYKKVVSNKKINLFSFNKRNPDSINVKHYAMDLSQVKSYARENQCKINELVLAMFYQAIESINTKNKNISLGSPIDMRKHFDSKTLRNFSLVASISFDKKYKSYMELIQHIRKQMAIQNTKEYLGYQIARIARVYQNPIINKVPLGIKSKLIALGHHIGKRSCMTISNLGLIHFPEDCVEKIEAILGPRKSTPLNCGVVSLKDKMMISITHDDTHVELFEALENQFKQLNFTYTQN